MCCNFDLHIFKRVIHFFSYLLQESTSNTLKARRQMDAYKITFLEDESNVAGSSQGDTENKWSVIYILCFQDM